MYHVCIAICPAAHLDKANKLLSLVMAPTAPASPKFSVGLMPTATEWDPETDDPYEFITHWLAGLTPGTPEQIALLGEQIAVFHNLASEIPTPPGGWPWTVGGVVQMTLAEAQEAAAVVTFTTSSQATVDTSLALRNLAAAKAANGLKGLDV